MIKCLKKLFKDHKIETKDKTEPFLSSSVFRQYTATREWRLNNDVDNILNSEVRVGKKNKISCLFLNRLEQNKRFHLKQGCRLKLPSPPQAYFKCPALSLEITF